MARTITLRIDDVEYRLTRDGLELRPVSDRPIDQFWDSVNTDREPDAHEQMAFETLERLHAEL